MASVTVKVKIAWWFKFYVYGMVIGALTRCQPDQKKLAYWCKRAIKLKVVNGK